MPSQEQDTIHIIYQSALLTSIVLVMKVGYWIALTMDLLTFVAAYQLMMLKSYAEVLYCIHCHEIIYVVPVDVIIQPDSCSTGDVRLVDGPVESAGRLEVCVNQNWGTVCSRSWSTLDGKVLCRQLGYQETGTCMIHHFALYCRHL